MLDLKRALVTRGYPASALVEKQYCILDRHSRLSKLSRRQMAIPGEDRSRSNKLVFSTVFSQFIRSLSLNHECRSLFDSLKCQSLMDARVVVANRSNHNSFILTYRSNFPMGG